MLDPDGPVGEAAMVIGLEGPGAIRQLVDVTDIRVRITKDEEVVEMTSSCGFGLSGGGCCS